MMETPDESDQLPEEGPAEQTPDDTGAAKGGRHDNPGVAGDDDPQPGNPGAAGSRESGPRKQGGETSETDDAGSPPGG